MPPRSTRQPLGQHFLADTGWRRRIFQTLPLAVNGETWLEIGAGHGEMTSLLAGALQSSGGRVIAIEADPRLAGGLRDRAAGEWPNVEVAAGDVLKLELERLAGEKCRVYGNLPYYITSPILHRLFEMADRIASIHIVIQFEVAARIAARPGRRDYGYLSTLCQYFAKPEIQLRIPAGAFRPAPRVTSALVRMTLPGERASLGIADDAKFLEFVQACFGQKRKTLRNNLRTRARGDRLRAALAAAGARPDARAEQLTLVQFAALFRELA
jgi:16S rRNA (adenine1518-N6/adenine1519-N6)-dimethyltransferase